MIQCRDVEHAVKSKAPIPTPNQKGTVTETLCLMWTTLSQAKSFLNSKLSCYTFTDHEAVIEIITKGRSPTMRHVSRTHRVSLDCLFDRINLDRKIQIKCVDTMNQLAGMMTSGKCTRDEWSRLLRLFGVVSFSMSSCSQFLSNKKKPNTMSKRARGRRAREELAVVKSRPVSLVTRNLSAKQSPPLDSGI